MSAAKGTDASAGSAREPLLREGAMILGLETSCDETAASVVEVREGALRVRSTVVATQHAVHEQFKGVVPELASRAHLERLLPVVERSLASANCALTDLSAVAVGHRPGLIGSLLVGVAAAKALAWTRGLPFLGVDHVAAHLVAGELDRARIAWPALGLVVSGGHTHLLWMESPLRARVLGRTIDDAVGEAFDKAAVILGLGYPGGPQLDAASDGGNEHSIPLPVPALENGLDFSFSGLKTALLYAVKGAPSPARRPQVPPVARNLSDCAASFQRAAVTQVVQRTERALALHPAATLLVGGGVAANRRLRRDLTVLAEKAGIGLRLPDPSYCVDNAAMIAALAHYRLAAGESDPLDLAPCPHSALAAPVGGAAGTPPVPA